METLYRIQQRKWGENQWRWHAFSLGATREQCEQWVKEKARDGYELRIVPIVARRNGGR
jgi:hypothetical protein